MHQVIESQRYKINIINLSRLIVALLAGNKSGNGLLNLVALGYGNWTAERPKQNRNYASC